jgi:adenosylcobinamide-phosphate synthase
MLRPDPSALIVAVAADLILGDPVYPAHPIRLIGATLSAFEARLRRVGMNGYGGGVLLFASLAVVWVGGASAALVALSRAVPAAGWAAHAFLVYSLLALGDLLHHGWRIEKAVQRGDLPLAREAVSRLVGRDTAGMDAAACRRAAVESLSENLTDGFISPLFYYAAAGIPGIVLFKVVSTMDSMVGYKTPRYLQFGWCGARLDDVLNFVPARVAWLLIAAAAGLLPRCSCAKALRVGRQQHGLLPGPNAGWSEAAAAGGVQRRLVGPIRLNGQLVTDLWLGDAGDPALETAADYERAARLVLTTGLIAAAAAVLLLIRYPAWHAG